MIYLRLFWEYFKIGLFSIGGGMATVPFLQDLGEKTDWFTSAELANMIAISESTPGPIGVNMATYVGNTTAGVLGGVIATFGLITPSIIVILIIAEFLDRFKTNKYVSAAFYGLKSASVALIAAAGFSIILIAFLSIENLNQLTSASIDYRYLILALILLVLTRWVPTTKKLHPIVFIIISAVVGIVFKF